MDNKTKTLLATFHKLYKRNATENIRRIFEKSHPADIAVVVESFPIHDQLKLFEIQKDEARWAEIISHLEDSTQKQILLELGIKRAQGIVSEMEPDDAADILAELPEDFSADILASMDREDSVEVSDLMGYPEDSAGGLMSSDFFALSEELTIRDAISSLQEDEDDLITFYVYVVNDSGHLIGVLSLKQLLLYKPGDRLKDIMLKDVISVNVGMPQDEVAHQVEKYDFLSIPVTDDSNKLVGVITVDDVIDVIREETEEELLAMGRVDWGEDFGLINHLKARLPWVLLTFLGGALSFVLIYLFMSHELKTAVLPAAWLVGAFIPVILTVGATVGNQAVTVAVGLVRGAEIPPGFWRHVLVEVQVGVLLGVFFAAIVYGVFYWLEPFRPQFGYALSTALLVHIVLSVVLGAMIPLMMKRINVDPTVSSVPIITSIIDVLAVIVLFVSAFSWGILIW